MTTNQIAVSGGADVEIRTLNVRMAPLTLAMLSQVQRADLIDVEADNWRGIALGRIVTPDGVEVLWRDGRDLRRCSLPTAVTTPLSEQDIDLAGIDIVVNTHLHFDHCGGNHLFAGTPIHVQRRELDDAMRSATATLAQVTNLLAVVSAPPLDTATIRHVEVLLLQPQVAMVVVITSTGGVSKRMLTFDDPVDPGVVSWAGAYLNERLTVIRERDSAVISVYVRSADPQLAAGIANAIAAEHVKRRAGQSVTDTAEATAWLAQQIREATPFGEGPRFLICDNDGKYSSWFDHAVDGAGITLIHTPPYAPRANAMCERFMGSVRRELLDHILILSEGHARRLAKEYVQYFNYARPHQGIDGQLPVPSPAAFLLPPRDCSLRRIPILNGLHHVYQWAA